MVACPKGVNTGGPEALHQLASSVSSFGFETFLWDPNSNEIQNQNDNYFLRYEATWTNSPPSKGDALIIPEVMGHLVPKFYGECQCILWWLSVDNFYISNKIPFDILLHGFPKVIHATQSEYARNFLEVRGVHNIAMLTDYLNRDFIEVIA